MKVILSALAEGNDNTSLELLTKWYKKDTNADPPLFVLQPTLKDDEQGDTTQEQWACEQMPLANGLKKAVQSCINKNTMSKQQSRKYFQSGMQQS